MIKVVLQLSRAIVTSKFIVTTSRTFSRPCVGNPDSDDQSLCFSAIAGNNQTSDAQARKVCSKLDAESETI